MLNMTAAVSGKWVALEAYLPARAPVKIGILLLNESEDELLIRLCPDWAPFDFDEYEAEVWRGLGEDLQERARCMGATEALEWLETTGSHALRTTDLQVICFEDAETTLDDLYKRHILCLDGSDLHDTRPHQLAIVKPNGVRLRQLSRPNSSSQISLSRWFSVAAAATVMLSGQLLEKSPARTGLTLPALMNSYQRWPELSYNTASALHPVLVDLSIPESSFPVPQRHFRRKHTSATHVVKTFHIDPIVRIAKRPVIEVAVEKPLELSFPAELNPVPVSLVSSPPAELPRFKRRNPLVRFFAVVATPFRLLAQKS